MDWPRIGRWFDAFSAQWMDRATVAGLLFALLDLALYVFTWSL